MPLPFRAEMERSFGQDFGGVTVHAGPKAAAANEAMGSRAFTRGTHIVLGAEPPSRELIAHELAHVVQQGAAGANGGDGGAAGGSFEDEADAAASRVLRGEPAEVAGRAPVGVQAVKVEGLQAGDTVLVRSGAGWTNDVATKKAQQGSEKYKGNNRYTTSVKGSIEMGAGPGQGQTLALGTVKTRPENHHDYSSLQGGIVVTDPSQNVFSVVVKGGVVGAVAPTKGAIQRGDLPLAPGGVPAIDLEPGEHKNKLDVIVLSPGWEGSYGRTEGQSDGSNIGETKIERGTAGGVAVALPIGPVKAGEVLDVATSVDVKAETGGQNQLATHFVLLTRGPHELAGERITIKHGRNVPSQKTETVGHFGALTVRGDYPEGAWLNVVVCTMSEGASGFLRVLGSSRVRYTRYTAK